MDIFQLRFTFGELISLLGMSQAIFIVVYILFRTRQLVREGLPLVYFAFLASALFLDAGGRMLGSHIEYYSLLQWIFWFSGPPLSVLLIFQISQVARLPSSGHYRVLALIPLSFFFSYIITIKNEKCSRFFACEEFLDLLIVSGVIAGALSLLEIWFGRGVLNNLRTQKNGKERYWLVIMLVMMNIAFLAVMLASVSDMTSAVQTLTIRGVLAISLAYLASTILFRIYPQSVRNTHSDGKEKALSDAELDTAMKIEKLMELEKIYQEPSYSRADLARELEISEAVLSRIINMHFRKSFSQMLNEHRVEDAKRLLRQTSVPIGTITGESGFNSLASFNRVFKEITGITPSRYRSNNTEI